MLSAEDEQFRWPTTDDLVAIEESNMPKLAAIRADSGQYGLLNFQLVFDTGLESPIFAGKKRSSSVKWD